MKCSLQLERKSLSGQRHAVNEVFACVPVITVVGCDVMQLAYGLCTATLCSMDYPARSARLAAWQMAVSDWCVARHSCSASCHTGNAGAF